MGHRNHDPKATANQPLGDDEGGNTDQPATVDTPPADAGKAGPAGLAKAKRGAK